MISKIIEFDNEKGCSDIVKISYNNINSDFKRILSVTVYLFYVITRNIGYDSYEELGNYGLDISESNYNLACSYLKSGSSLIQSILSYLKKVYDWDYEFIKVDSFVNIDTGYSW